MAKVRGITVEVAADAKKFNQAMGEIRADAKNTQKDLSTLQKGLELDFDSKKFKEAQTVAQQALEATAARAEGLRLRMAELEKSGNVDTDEYRKLQSELRTAENETAKLNKQIEQLNKMPLDNLVKNIDKVSAGFNKVSAATRGISMAAGGALAGLGALGLKAVSVADDIATTATKIGITAEELQKFNYIALQTDVDAEKLSKGFVKARAAVVDMATGVSNNASKALEKLQIDFSQFSNADEAFYGIIDALGKTGSEAEMLAAANEIFGDKLANDLIPIIKAGGGAIAELGAEFETLGGLSNEQVAKLAEFDNVINKIKTQVQNLFLQIGTALLPVMERLAAFVEEKIVPAIQKLADWFGKLSDKQIETGLKALAAVAMISPLLGMIGKITSIVSGIIKIIPVLNSALSTLAANPIIAIIGVIAIILLLIYTTNEQFRESINKLIGLLGGALAPILDILMGVLNTILDALSPILQLVGDLLTTITNVITEGLQPLFDIISLLVEIISNVLGDVLSVVTGLITTLFNAIKPLVDILGTVLTVALDAVFTALAPVFAMLNLLLGLIQPLIEIALLPLQIQLQMLSVPLKLLGDLLNWIMPLFDAFANIVSGVFNFIMKIINKVLGWVEDAINWVIDKINALIRGINNLGGWLGIHINEMSKVSLQIKTSTDEQYKSGGVNTGGAPSAGNTPTTEYPNGGSWYDGIDSGSIYNGDVYNTDNSTKNVTIEVVVQNYAAEADIDKMVDEINRKLAEAM